MVDIPGEDAQAGQLGPFEAFEREATADDTATHPRAGRITAVAAGPLLHSTPAKQADLGRNYQRARAHLALLPESV